MSVQILLPLILALYISHGSKGQELLAEFALTSNQTDQIQAFEINDKIFLSFREHKVYRNYWISPNGEKSEVALQIPFDRPVSAVLQEGDKTLYYFLSKINGNMALQAMEQDAGAPETKLFPSIFLLPGKPLGLHANAETITVVSYLQKNNQVRVLKIKGSVFQYDRYFDMPFDLTAHIKNNAGFITAKEVASIEQGSKMFKLYLEGESIVLSIDVNEPGLENKHTTVIKLNAATGEKEVYQLGRKNYDEFVSFYDRNKVYQLSLASKRLSCDVFDLSGKHLFSREIDKQKELKDHKIIVQRGKSKVVDYTNLYELFTNPEFVPSILVETAAGSDPIRLVLGAAHYYVESGSIPIPFAEFIFLLTIVTSEHSNARYFTLIGNCESGFDFEPLDDNPTPSVRTLIDTYEMSRTSATRHDDDEGWNLLYKGYLELEDGVLGIYLLDEKKLTLLKYGQF